MHAIADKIIGGDLVYSIDQARDVLDALAEMAPRNSNEFWTDPVLECDASGQRQLVVIVCHCGDTRAAEREIAALRKIGKPARDTIGARPFATLQTEHDADSPHGRGYYMNGGLVQALTPALLTHVIASIQRPGAELGKISLTQHGGAIPRCRLKRCFRQSQRFTQCGHSRRLGFARGDSSAYRMAKETWKGVQPHSTAIYANLNLGDADPRTVSAYGPNLSRLVDLKRNSIRRISFG